MKKIILTTITSFLLIGYSIAANVIVITSDGSGLGSDRGYKNITEEHLDEGDGTGMRSWLNCHNPGNSQCVWMYEPTVNGTSPNTVHYEVKGQLELGMSSGSLTFDGCIATWTSESKGGYKLTIIYND